MPRVSDLSPPTSHWFEGNFAGAQAAPVGNTTGFPFQGRNEVIVEVVPDAAALTTDHSYIVWGLNNSDEWIAFTDAAQVGLGAGPTSRRLVIGTSYKRLYVQFTQLDGSAGIGTGEADLYITCPTN